MNQHESSPLALLKVIAECEVRIPHSGSILSGPIIREFLLAEGPSLRAHPRSQKDDIERFFALPGEQQFEDWVRLRMSAAHLGGGSFGAFTAIYLTVVLGAATFLSSALSGVIGLTFTSMTVVGAVVLVGGLLVAIGLAKPASEEWSPATHTY